MQRGYGAWKEMGNGSSCNGQWETVMIGFISSDPSYSSQSSGKYACPKCHHELQSWSQLLCCTSVRSIGIYLSLRATTIQFLLFIIKQPSSVGGAARLLPGPFKTTSKVQKTFLKVILDRLIAPSIIRPAGWFQKKTHFKHISYVIGSSGQTSEV